MRICRNVDHRVKLKESEKRDTYMDLAQEQKKLNEDKIFVKNTLFLNTNAWRFLDCIALFSVCVCTRVCVWYKKILIGPKWNIWVFCYDGGPCPCPANVYCFNFSY